MDWDRSLSYACLRRYEQAVSGAEAAALVGRPFVAICIWALLLGELAQAFTTGFSDPVLTAGQSVVRAPHLTQLRDALAEARRNLWLLSLTYTDPTITAAASQIRAIHMNELSGGVR